MIIERELIVIGAGPAGLSASIEAAKAGVDVLLLDENDSPGGQLFKQIHKFFGSSSHKAGKRGIDIGRKMLKESNELGIETWLNTEVLGFEADDEIWVLKNKKEIIRLKSEKIILATGATENAISFPGWDLPGVMGAGAAQTMVNINRVKPGKKVVMVGSGNVGVIVSYQLLQAGVEVVAIVEAAPKLGGYGVHTAKVRRLGVPFYTSHTIKRAIGEERVEKVELIELDSDFKEVEDTEFIVEADTICLATGLTSLTELAHLAECDFTYIRALSGNIPIHNENMKTTNKSVYVAGDIAGVEEASTAMDEGRLAGINVAGELGYISGYELNKKRNRIIRSLESLRCGEFGQIRQESKNNIFKEANEVIR